MPHHVVLRQSVEGIEPEKGREGRGGRREQMKQGSLSWMKISVENREGNRDPILIVRVDLQLFFLFLLIKFWIQACCDCFCYKTAQNILTSEIARRRDGKEKRPVKIKLEEKKTYIQYLTTRTGSFSSVILTAPSSNLRLTTSSPRSQLYGSTLTSMTLL